MSQQDTFQSLITQAKTVAEQQGTTVEYVLEQWEAGNESFKGVVSFFQGKSNGTPPAPVMPSPTVPAVTPSNVETPPEQALVMLNQIASNFDEKPEKCYEIYWEKRNQLSITSSLAGNDLDTQACFFVQTQIQDDNTGNNGQFEFTLLRVIRPHQREVKDKQPHPSGEGTQEFFVKKWSAGGYGLFTKVNNDGTTETRIGKVQVWDEEIAKTFNPKPLTKYRANLDIKTSVMDWQTSINKDPEMQEVAPVTLQELKVQLQDLARQTQKIVTPAQLEHYQINPNGELLMVEGRIGSCFTNTTKTGKVTGTIKLMEPNLIGDKNAQPAWIKFWDQVSDIHEFAQGSHVIIPCWSTPGNTQYPNPNFNGQFQIPIMTVPGSAPNQPTQPTPSAFTPPPGSQ